MVSWNNAFLFKPLKVLFNRNKLFSQALGVILSILLICLFAEACGKKKMLRQTNQEQIKFT